MKTIFLSTVLHDNFFFYIKNYNLINIWINTELFTDSFCYLLHSSIADAQEQPIC